MYSFYFRLFLFSVISFTVSYILLKEFIEFQNKSNNFQEVSEYALKQFKDKKKTPVMGGVIFVLVPCVLFLLLFGYEFIFESRKIEFISKFFTTLLFPMLIFFFFGLIGFVDDYLILKRKNNDGLSPKVKLILEFIVATLLVSMCYGKLNTIIYIPYTEISIDLGILIYPICVFAIVSMANACNFTDGMDGLCAGVSIIGLIPLCVIDIVYVAIPYFRMPLATLILFSLIAYLIFNYHPAKIFMGDTGSLAIGSFFAAYAFTTNMPIIFLLFGFVFIFEIVIVCIQLTSVKLFKKRVFSYTPIHYAFVLKGKKEVRVVNNFYVLQLIATIISIILYFGKPL